MNYSKKKISVPKFLTILSRSSFQISKRRITHSTCGALTGSGNCKRDSGAFPTHFRPSISSLITINLRHYLHPHRSNPKASELTFLILRNFCVFVNGDCVEVLWRYIYAALCKVVTLKLSNI